MRGQLPDLLQPCPKPCPAARSHTQENVCEEGLPIDAVLGVQEAQAEEEILAAAAAANRVAVDCLNEGGDVFSENRADDEVGQVVRLGTAELAQNRGVCRLPDVGRPLPQNRRRWEPYNGGMERLVISQP